MFDINYELEKILKKYNIAEQSLMKERIETFIRSLVSEAVIKYGQRIILRGLKHSPKEEYPTLEILSEYGTVVAVVDKHPFAEGVQLKNGRYIPIVDEQKGKELLCDIYIVNSVYNGRSICQELFEYQKKYYILDLYLQLRIMYGIAPYRTFDEYEDERDFSHNKTHEAYLAFQEDRNKRNLEKLASACLTNRDFVTFYEVISEAKDVIDNAPEFLRLKKDIDVLLDKVRKEMEKRRNNTKKDIIIHWMDSLAYDDLKYMPRLCDEILGGGYGLLFENAYAVTPYTIAAETCIFYPNEMNRRSLHEIISLHGLEDSELYKEIIKREYKFIVIGNMALECRQEAWNEFSQIMVASSVYYWNTINQILQSEKPVFCIIGCLAETHEPWMSPKTDTYNPSFEFSGRIVSAQDKIKESAHYYDLIVDFFYDLFPTEAIHIYMSDHGKWEDIEFRRYSDYAMHTILGITNIGISGKVSRIFSYQDFAKLILWIMNYADNKSSQHIFKDMELRSEGFRAAILSSLRKTYKCNEDIEQKYSDICSGYIGIKTDNDTYVRLDSGKEIYYLGTHEHDNMVDDPRYALRVMELKERLKQRNES